MKQVDIIMDSGAFSVYTKGEVIDMDAYIEYIKEWKRYLTAYVALDVIGDAEGSFKNWIIMKEAGLDPIPIYHLHEPTELLYRYMKLTNYIGVGGVASRMTARNNKILFDNFWRRVVDEEGMPKVKVHGMGITDVDVMTRYPWFCMTEEDHQVLTKYGWKVREELKVGEEILAFDNGRAEWQKIEAIPTFAVENISMCHLHNRNFEAFVTEDHRWNSVRLIGRKKDRFEYKFKKTSELNGTDLIPRVCETYEFPEISPFSDEQICLLAWFWTDGSIKKRPRYKNDSILIYQSERGNHRKCVIIRKLLQRAGEKFCESKSKKDQLIHFELYGDISKWLLSIAPNKVLPNNLPTLLTKRQTKLFVKHSMLGDGYKTQLVRTKGCAISVSREVKKENLNILRVMYLLLGIPTSLSFGTGNYTTMQTSSVKRVYVQKLRREKFTYTGNIWCVQVPSKAFFTKCKDNIYVTGNSIDSSTWLMCSRRGILIAPKFKDGKPNPLKAKRIEVSTKSPHRKEYGTHIENISPLQRTTLLNYIHGRGFKMGSSHRDENGVTLDKENGREDIIERGLSNYYIDRDYFNLDFFIQLERALPDWPWSWPSEKLSFQPSIFDTPVDYTAIESKRFRKCRTKIYLAGEGVKEKEAFEVIQAKGSPYRRMLSYPFRKTKGLRDILPLIKN
jgi:hypothetical protein